MSAVNDILRFSLRHVLDATEDQVNTFHFRVAAPPSPNNSISHLEDISGFLAQMYAEFQSTMPSELDVVDLTGYNLTADSPFGQWADFGAYTGGTGSGDYLPPTNTMLALLRTGVKRVTGRLYLPVMGEGQQTNGRWGSGTITTVEEALAFLLSPVTGPNAGEYTPVVYSPSAGVGYPIQGITIQPLVAKMSSRKPGRGS